MSSPQLIHAENVAKSFGAAHALRSASITIEAGRVHGLVGANGAGKTTFLHMLDGSLKPDSGTLEIDGAPADISDPRASAALGFAFIHQELALIPEFSSIDNMTIGDIPRTFGGIGDRRRRRAAALSVAQRLGITHNLEKPVKELSVAERGLVAIGRALVGEARFVAMDEPTASLSDVECERLFTIIKELSESGVAIAYVSHRLNEIERLCDNVTIFKDGTTVSHLRRGEYTRSDLIDGITGVGSFAEATAQALEGRVDNRGDVLLKVRHLNREPRVKDVSFDLRKGEILGLAGVVGAGRTEAARIVFGAELATAGAMTLDGKPFRPRSIGDAIESGVALVPEERRSQALVMEDSITTNISLGNWKASRFFSWLSVIDDHRARDKAKLWGEKLGIKTRSVTSPVKTLSGGNQQKVVFARWLARDPRVLLLDEPTRGVDIGARRQIWKTVEDFASGGGSAVVICSELQELSICDRVVVLVEGRDVAVLDGPGVSEEQILHIIYSYSNSEGETS